MTLKAHDPAGLRLQDRPIENEREGALDRGPFVEGLTRALIRERRDDLGKIISRSATGYVVGLVGRWGLGKSSILRLLSLRLSSMSGVAVVTFDPWLFKGREELLRACFGSLREALGRTGGNTAWLRPQVEQVPTATAACRSSIARLIVDPLRLVAALCQYFPKQSGCNLLDRRDALRSVFAGLDVEEANQPC